MRGIDLRLTTWRHLVDRLRDRWRQPGEPCSVRWTERVRVAAGQRMTPGDVLRLVDLGPDAAALLFRRLTVLGITRTDVERISSGLAYELERTCACCDHKQACTSDLKIWPGALDWHDYCPNAIALEATRMCRGRFPA